MIMLPLAAADLSAVIFDSKINLEIGISWWYQWNWSKSSITSVVFETLLSLYVHCNRNHRDLFVLSFCTLDCMRSHKISLKMALSFISMGHNPADTSTRPCLSALLVSTALASCSVCFCFCFLFVVFHHSSLENSLWYQWTCSFKSCEVSSLCRILNLVWQSQSGTGRVRVWTFWFYFS